MNTPAPAIIKAPSVAQAALARAAAALGEAMTAILAEDRRGKFLEVERLSKIAIALDRARGQRLADGTVLV